jgi:hypothetical protein
VELGKSIPSFGISRFNSGLRFVPPDDEGFSLRGDKRRLVYKGRRRSHRFTILGDSAFEYDCILEREPESNVVTLLLEGAEQYDFFRQPDFVPDPFLKGSYAVYKKETLLGEGTGKLCHIHRPEIIDAQGRRCWGDLAIVGNELRITIPEKWLSEAKYPVVVDPTVGTSTVGSQTKWYDEDNEEVRELFFEISIATNRFYIPENFSGTATAYVYAHNRDYDGNVRPVLFSDNNNVPRNRLTKAESMIDVAVNANKLAGWRSTTFQSKDAVSAGSYAWLGISCVWFNPRFDYGAKCYWDWADDYYNDVTETVDIPDVYPVWSANWFFDFKLSMYFTYTSAQNYIYTLRQGVTLTDIRKINFSYKRVMTQICNAQTELMRFRGLCIALLDSLKVISNNSRNMVFYRTIKEHPVINDVIHRLGDFFRGLEDEAGADSKVNGGWVLFTRIVDIAQAAGSVTRGLGLFVRIVTKVFIRDYFLDRFLKSKLELVLKSCIVRELCLDSKIN